MRYLTQAFTEYEKAIRDLQNELKETGTVSTETKQKVATARNPLEPQFRAIRLLPAHQKNHIPCALRGKK